MKPTALPTREEMRERAARRRQRKAAPPAVEPAPTWPPPALDLPDDATLEQASLVIVPMAGLLGHATPLERVGRLAFRLGYWSRVFTLLGDGRQGNVAYPSQQAASLGHHLQSFGG